jgi:putative tricarboxylic transport membrane protein
MVLGKLMEDRFRTAMARVDTPWEFIDRPIAFILFCMIVLAVVSQIWTVLRGRKNNRKAMPYV